MFVLSLHATLCSRYVRLFGYFHPWLFGSRVWSQNPSLSNRWWLYVIYNPNENEILDGNLKLGWGWEWNQLTPSGFLISVIGSNPSQKPQGNAGPLSFSGTSPILSLKSVGCFVMPLLETWEGFKPMTSQSRVHRHPLQYITRVYLL